MLKGIIFDLDGTLIGSRTDEQGNYFIHNGIEKCLDYFKENNVCLSIVTGRSAESAKILLKRFMMIDRFVTIVTNNDVSQPKPSPEGVFQAVEMMNLPPQEIIMIGDSGSDIKAAHNAQIQAVAVTWDKYADKNRLESFWPEYWAEHPDDLINLWNEIGDPAIS